MKTTFTIHYNTVFGENLVLEAGDRKYPMQWQGDGIWSVTLQRCTSAMLKSYRYLVVRDGIIERSEWTEHHIESSCAISDPSGKSGAAGSAKPKTLVIHDNWIDCPVPGCPFGRKHSASMFDAPGFRGAGTAVPLFALRTEDDFGIGDFRDLRPLVDWAAATGQCIIQLLPINDTTRKGGWDDSYPYSPISSFALHPIYLRLQDIGVKADAAFRKEQAALNALPEIDYPRVFAAKMALVRKAWEERGAKDLAKPAFRKFCKQNEGWLGEYAGFCARRDDLEPEYYAWMQFHLDRQLSEEVAYARSRGIVLKGDLPIGVSADSAEAHFHPELFNLDSSAGAPPDYFSADGQNWGFPTYNWDAMAADGYAWWKARLRVMARYFDAFRIDHILGFFRIWEIPAGERSGTEGHFNPALPYSLGEIQAAGLPLDGLFHEDPRHPGMYQPLIAPRKEGLDSWQLERFDSLYNDFFFHRHDEFWRIGAMKKLPELLGATQMLACGEDLGMVPDCVPGVMAHESILSLKMRGMSSDGPLSVCATSSHDMPTLRMQCQTDPEPWECLNLLSDSLHTPSMLAIFPIQDWLALSGSLRRSDRAAERINEPADPHHHWRYRLHVTLDSLRDAAALNARIAELIRHSGR